MWCLYNSVVHHLPFQNISPNYCPWIVIPSKVRREKYTDAHQNLQGIRKGEQKPQKMGVDIKAS